jgi:hypothetical protein
MNLGKNINLNYVSKDGKYYLAEAPITGYRGTY